MQHRTAALSADHQKMSVRTTTAAIRNTTAASSDFHIGAPVGEGPLGEPSLNGTSPVQARAIGARVSKVTELIFRASAARRISAWRKNAAIRRPYDRAGRRRI